MNATLQLLFRSPFFPELVEELRSSTIEDNYHWVDLSEANFGNNFESYINFHSMLIHQTKRRLVTLYDQVKNFAVEEKVLREMRVLFCLYIKEKNLQIQEDVYVYFQYLMHCLEIEFGKNIFY